MDKREFFEELNKRLEDISSEEKAEAISFYENYFEDAGIENEELILKELVSPQKVADSIKQSIDSNEREQLAQGYYTEKGYEESYSNINRQELSVPESKPDTNSDQSIYLNRINKENASNPGRYAGNNTGSNPESNAGNNTGSNPESNAGYNTGRNAESYTGSNAGSNYKNRSNDDNYYNNSANQNYHRDYNQSKSKPNILLIIVLGIILLPIGLPLVITIITFMFSIAITVISIWLVLAATSALMLISAVIIIGVSLFQLFTIPALGFLLAGVGLIILGVGSLFLLLTIWMTKTVMPFLFNGIKSLLKLPFQNRRTFA